MDETIFKASCDECGRMAIATCSEQMRDVGWEINEKRIVCPVHSGHDEREQ